jgi:hypothetical protein
VADRALWYGQSGCINFDDAIVGWYGVDSKPLRGARTSQIYLEDAPVDDLEVVRLADLKVGVAMSMFLLMGA